MKKTQSKRKGMTMVLAIMLCLLISTMCMIGVFFAAVMAMDSADSTYVGEWEEVLIDGNEEKWLAGSEEKIVQISVEGVIMEEESAGMMSDGFSLSGLLSQLDQAKEDPTVQAVVLKVNSPGGGVVASDLIHSKIKELQKQGIKVVVSMGTVAASGGYYISAPADKIYANPFTFTGSLGVIMSLPNYEQLAEKIGYKENTITSGEFKDIGNPLREMNEEEAAIFKSLVDESYEGFVDIIAKGRKMEKETVRAIADGRIYSGKQAKKLGLVDELGDADDATQEAKRLIKNTKAVVVEYDYTEFGFEALFAELSQSFPDVLGTQAVMKKEPTGLMYLTPGY